MKTPEEIALIGGGILLSSGLVFGLKSGAASELPNVSRSVDTALQGKKNADSSSSSSSDSANAANQAAAQKKQQQEQAQQEANQKQQAFENSFDGKYQKAQQNHWQTGNWGSAKFYVDDQANLHVGSGQLSGTTYNAVGQSRYESLKTINLDGTIQAPQDSSELFGADSIPTNSSIIAINGLNNLDTSQINNAQSMFGWLTKVTNLDTSHFDTHNVTSMEGMFDEDDSLSSLDLSHFDTSNVTDMSNVFYDNHSLNSLDLSHFDTHNVTDMWYMFGNANVHQLTLGSNIELQNNSNNSNYDTYLSGTYQNNGQTLNLDGNAHPGTWTKQ